MTVRQNKVYIESIDDKQKQLERVMLQTITTIANIIDAKDEYTKGHSYRVAEYSSALAEELGWSKERVANVKYIDLLHDIGKILLLQPISERRLLMTKLKMNNILDIHIISV